MRPNRFVEVSKDDFEKYSEHVQAAHCMIYSQNQSTVDLGDTKYNPRANVLMQMRFDGHFGFAGGLVEPGEPIVTGLNRELEEEINFDSTLYKITDEHHVVTHWDKVGEYLLHFYVFEVPEKEIVEIEKRAILAHDHGHEVMGLFRIPLYTMTDGCRGFPTFLKNSFVGNCYDQLRRGLISASIFSEEDFTAAENQ